MTDKITMELTLDEYIFVRRLLRQLNDQFNDENVCKQCGSYH